VEKFGREMERRRRWRLAPVDTAPPLGRVHQESSTLETKGSEAITAAGCCAVAVTTWHACSDVFPSKVFLLQSLM
jgi:hypothetical protein